MLPCNWQSCRPLRGHQVGCPHSLLRPLPSRLRSRLSQRAPAPAAGTSLTAAFQRRDNTDEGYGPSSSSCSPSISCSDCTCSPSTSIYCDSGAGTRDGRVDMRRRRLLLGLLAQTAAGITAWAGTGPAHGEGLASAPARSGPPPPASPGAYLQPLLPSPAPDLLAQLEGRVPIFQPGAAWALRNRDRQLFYPSWLRGEWEVRARFAAASFPQGRRLLGRTVPGVLKGSMVVALPDVGAAIDAPVSYRARFVESPEEGGGVVADRVFNVRQLMDAFYGFDVTRRVEYDPVKNPTRLTVVYATPRQDKSIISEDLRKAELIINNRTSQRISPTDFICGELFRQISQASAQGAVGDYETITRFMLVVQGDVSGGEAAGEASIVTAAAAAPIPDAPAGVGAEVRVLQRVAAFLQPQDAAFFEAGNQAVAAYDYTYDMRRVS